MLDHVTLAVTDLDRSRAFYDRTLTPLGIERLYADGENYSGYGVRPKAFFWIGRRAVVLTGTHVAFAAADRATVDAFYEAAISAGAATTARRDFVRNTRRPITAPSSSTRTATTSRRCATLRRRQGASGDRLREMAEEIVGNSDRVYFWSMYAGTALPKLRFPLQPLAVGNGATRS